MNKTYLLVVITLLLNGCVSKGTSYNDQWSKAKNLTVAGGMTRQVHDQQLAAGAYNKEGLLLDYKLNSLFHPAYGNFSGITGGSMAPSGAFKSFYWGWNIPGASHRSNHRLFAWMPKNNAKDKLHAKQLLEGMVAKSAVTVLEEMQFKLQPVKTPYVYLGTAFQQWYIEDSDGDCSFQRMNCMLSIYIPEPESSVVAPSFSFYATAVQDAWLFNISDQFNYPRIALSQGGPKKTIAENVFYQKLSVRLPGWTYLYMAPDRVAIGENNETISYPYILEKGKPLLFIRPVK
ncbi:MAG: hypothetical protein QS748_05355 [Candidatus Endonucleobacter bathymodioli]|uniref:Uncharacterized protein n=1 Tax=Candidatus Endonucleibacter bathymodioli TaxID=539814 RepID=A0AA90NL07_9GAMM|nr:hypothetical protein [Candidatus Endonucleobacter bathymodioli]